jgi:hypothetical protein
MKKNFCTIIAAVMLLMAWGCKDDPATELTLGLESIQAPFAGGTFTMPVASNAASKATVIYDNPNDVGWVFMLPSVLNGNGNIEVILKPNNDMWNDRTATVTVTAGENIRTVSVFQVSKSQLMVEPSFITALDNAATYSVTVISKVAWTAVMNSDAAAWCTIDPTSGNSGTVTMTVDVDALLSTGTRTATITVSGGGLSETLTVQQSFDAPWVEINGLLWAKCNVGEPGQFASAPDNRGLLYQYDSKIGYSNCSPNTCTAPPGYVTGQFVLGDTWAPENNPCPAGWRIPTATEIDALIGDMSNKKYYFFDVASPSYTERGFACAGAVVGIPAAEAMLATKSNMRGGIFLPQTGYRNRDDGTQTNWWDAAITSITRPGHNWDRYI